MKCLYCQKEFVPNIGAGRPKKYCSGECRRNADRDNKRINYVGKRENICIQCGKELPKFKTKYCSHRCELIYKGAIQDHGELKKICPVCGKEFETWKSYQVTCSKECSKKRHNSRPRKPDYDHERYLKTHPGAMTREQRNEERKRQAEVKKASKAAAREKREKKLAKIQAKKAANKEFWLNYNRIHICNNCGQAYQAYNPLSKYCSDKCKKKAIKARNNKNEIILDEVTLEKLALRDNNVCQICGELVDWDDFIIKDNVKICGNRYPSRDHIYPKSKGGVTSWDNLQLAHRICNTLKNDKET